MPAKDLRAALDRLSLTQAAFARRLGVAPHTVGRWCREGAPSYARLAFLALWHRLDDPA